MAEKFTGIEYLDSAGVPGAVSFTDDERAALALINRRVAAGASLREIVDFVFHETRALMPCDRIGIAFLQEEGRRLLLYHVVASYAPLYLDAGYASDIRGSSLAEIFRAGTPRIINDLEEYLRANPSSVSTQLLVREGVRSSMTCPLAVEGRMVGLLFRSARVPRAYTAREIALHMAMAERLGQAVEKAYRIEELSSAFNAYMEMLGFVTHELKSPLSSIIQMGQTLAGGYLGAMEPPQRDMVERMMRRAEYLLALSGEYLNLSRFESGKFRLNPAAADFAADVLAPAIEIVQTQIDANRVRFERDVPEGMPPVVCDIELMRIVMVNLLSNAVKYGNVKGGVRLRVRREAGTLRVSVRNEGPGFPEAEKKNLFKKFSRLQTDELMGRKGSGIGLYMSWKIIAVHEGKIRADSSPGEWAEFSFEIPARES
jgi:signal transduction histidine kinase